MTTYPQGTSCEDLSEVAASVEHELSDQESSYVVRKRLRAERKKSTQEQIKGMKLRQRRSEVWKERHPYVQTICTAAAVTAACYLFYHFYWSTG